MFEPKRGKMGSCTQNQGPLGKLSKRKTAKWYSSLTHTKKIWVVIVVDFFLMDISSQSKYNDYQYVLKFVCVVWKKKERSIFNKLYFDIFPGNSITRIETNLQNAQKSLQKLKFCILNNLGFLWGFKILWQQVIAN